jgi:hypothetical protein
MGVIGSQKKADEQSALKIEFDSHGFAHRRRLMADGSIPKSCICG